MGSKKKIKSGPVINDQNVPYNYIVIIDAGSKGSRAYIYNWLSPVHLETQKKRSLNLVARVADDDDDENDDDDSDSDSEDEDDEFSKAIHTKPNWRKKIKPGISSFKNNPGSVGKDHIFKLLKTTDQVIPTEQQYRTPIFLHATAGMRLLKPNEQFKILDNICKYIQSHSKYYLPDCGSHINVINGDIEGLYGWIGLNYLMESFEGNTSYGLLDMGGASTQIAFSPQNKNEIQEHASTLYKLQLFDKKISNHDIFSTSFLGYGMYQSRNKYLNLKIEDYLKKIEKKFEKNLIINDPCLPLGLVKKELVVGTNNDKSFKVKGLGNFTECLNDLYPLLINEESKNNCDLNDPQEVSSCLLSESLPSLNFDIDKFIGISGYWDSIGNLLNLNDNHNGNHDNEYNYQSFYEKSNEICNINWQELKKVNDLKSKEKLSDLDDDELSELCYKSSWVLNVLHKGLGFPRYGLDDTNKVNKENTLHVAEKINGSDFSWTLGRAILYYSSENYEATKSLDESPNKVGFVYGLSTDTFNYGGEIEGVESRPSFEARDVKKNNEWKKSHRIIGGLVFFGLILLIGFLLLGKRRRSNIINKFLNKNHYLKLNNNDIELSDLNKDDDDDDDDDDQQFIIEEEDEEVV